MKTSAAYKELSYLDFLGLDHNPFPVAPDDENFYFGILNETELILFQQPDIDILMKIKEDFILRE